MISETMAGRTMLVAYSPLMQSLQSSGVVILGEREVSSKEEREIVAGLDRLM